MNQISADIARSILKDNAKVAISFKKADGTIKNTTGTLHPQILLKVAFGGNLDQAKEAEKKPVPIDHVTFWSLDDAGWRRFKVAELISMTIVI